MQYAEHACISVFIQRATMCTWYTNIQPIPKFYCSINVNGRKTILGRSEPGNKRNRLVQADAYSIWAILNLSEIQLKYLKPVPVQIPEPIPISFK
jgi:hypothetical protein